MTMTRRRIIARYTPRDLRNMTHTLSLHPWNNARVEWDRLEAACVQT